MKMVLIFLIILCIAYGYGHLLSETRITLHCPIIKILSLKTAFTYLLQLIFVLWDRDSSVYLISRYDADWVWLVWLSTVSAHRPEIRRIFIANW